MSTALLPTKGFSLVDLLWPDAARTAAGIAVSMPATAGYYTVEAAGEQKTVLSVREMIEVMREGGLPIAAIAEIARVERKTVYSWLNGSDVRLENEERVGKIYEALSATGLPFGGLWKAGSRTLISTMPLRTLLCADAVDPAAIRGACEELRPVVERKNKFDQARRPLAANVRNGFEADIPVADLS